jgi:hypothetical protein
MTAPINLVLSRLDKVKTAGAGKWKACCPAHDDCDPSLSIREADDGKVLLHCWAGCFTADVLATIGLTVRDLFPEVHGNSRAPMRRGPSKAAQQLEATVISIAVEQLRQGKPLSDEDRERFEQAKRRLGVA